MTGGERERRWQATDVPGDNREDTLDAPSPGWYSEERRWERRLWGILTKRTNYGNKDLMHLSILMQWNLFLAHLIVHCKCLVDRLPHGDSGKWKQALPILYSYWYPLHSSSRDRKWECGALRWGIFMGQAWKHVFYFCPPLFGQNLVIRPNRKRESEKCSVGLCQEKKKPILVSPQLLLQWTLSLNFIPNAVVSHPPP